MKTIHKYELLSAHSFSLDMPAGAKLLNVRVQRNIPYVWAFVDPAAPLVIRAFALRSTGHDAEGLDDAAHVGTFQLEDGDLVFHLFDLGEKEPGWNGSD